MERGHFDIHDLINWAEIQVVKCKRKDYQVIYQKFLRFLKRLREDRRRIFDERYEKPSEIETKIFEQPRMPVYVEPKKEPEMEIPEPPRVQRFKHKLKNVITFNVYKELLEKEG